MPAYLKYDDLKGDVREPAHRAWITLTSLRWGPSEGEIRVTKRVDRISTLLHQQVVSGKPVFAVIDSVRGEGDGGVDLRIEMSGTLIAALETAGRGGSTTETLTLAFEQVAVTPEPGTPPP